MTVRNMEDGLKLLSRFSFDTISKLYNGAAMFINKTVLPNDNLKQLVFRVIFF